MPKLIVFDLDGTLAESKLAIKPDMAALLRQLLDEYQVGVLGGLKFAEFKAHLIDPLQALDDQLTKLHILPTNGTHYYRFDKDTKIWQEIYADEIPADARSHIALVIENEAKKLGYWESKTWGPIIEDRESQITFSALGQAAPILAKKAWDPEGAKKQQLRDELAAVLPGFAVHSAGLTSIDVTIGGLDKASAITKLKDVLGLHKAEVVYVGDALAPGGNDAVVREADFETITVKSPADTAKVIEKLLAS